MSRAVCNLTGCTVNDTGTCLLNTDPTGCPHLIGGVEHSNNQAASEQNEPDDDQDPPEEDEEAGRQFHPGYELGLAATARLMQSKYVRIVGVLGQYDAGKSCLLNAIYLKTCIGDMGPYEFSGSFSLQAFEERVRLVRKWDSSGLPDQFSEHTSADARTPAFLHIAFRNRESRKRHEVLFPDIPGEWCSALIKQASASQRFQYLRRADAILYVLDGPLLVSDQQHVQVLEACCLLERLAETLQIGDIPVILLVSKADQIDLVHPPAIDDILERANELGLNCRHLLTSSFSRNPKVASGHGVLEALQSALEIAEPVPSTFTIPANERLFADYLKAGAGGSLNE